LIIEDVRSKIKLNHSLWNQFMGMFDLLEDLFAPSEFKFDKRVWSERHVHELHTCMHIPRGASGEVKILDQVGRILRYGKVPNDAGVYVIREWKSNTYVYVGQSGGPATATSGIRTRLTAHLSDRGCPYLREGVFYEIRWAVTSSRDPSRSGKGISGYGAGAEKIAEALAVLFFRPEHNDRKYGTDWQTNLKAELGKKRGEAIMTEAERLGFLRGSRKSRDRFYQRVMSFAGN
jgi:hypothetical protein